VDHGADVDICPGATCARRLKSTAMVCCNTVMGLVLNPPTRLMRGASAVVGVMMVPPLIALRSGLQFARGSMRRDPDARPLARGARSVTLAVDCCMGFSTHILPAP